MHLCSNFMLCIVLHIVSYIKLVIHIMLCVNIMLRVKLYYTLSCTQSCPRCAQTGKVPPYINSKSQNLYNYQILHIMSILISILQVITYILITGLFACVMVVVFTNNKHIVNNVTCLMLPLLLLIAIVLSILSFIN